MAEKRKDTRKGDRHRNRTRASEAARMRAIDDNALAIDAQLAEARNAVDWKRRRKAEKSLAAWVATYCTGVLIDTPPPPNGVRILDEMDAAVGDSRGYQILMARGHGKTSYTEACAAYAIATGRRKFCIVCSINATQAKQILADIARVFESETFAQDYPDVGLPIALLDGHIRREQRQGGHSVDYKKTADTSVLPTITDEDGNPVPTSGSCIKARAITSARGAKHGSLRPDMVILDDLQTTETAHNPEQVAKILNLIRGDIMGLAGKNKAAIICTATTIAPDDVTEQLRRDKSWKTTLFRAVIKWPDEWFKPERGLWGQYLKMLDAEDANDRPHKESLKFYKEHREAMDAGSEVLFPDRYSKKDGFISSLQKLICTWREMGAKAFAAEMQMEPQKERYAFEISAKLILSRARRGVQRGSVPDGFVFTAAATDINPSYALTTAIIAFDRDRTGLVVDHVITPIRIDSRVNDTEYSRKIYEALAEHGRTLKANGVKLDAWGIDAGGKQFDAVTSFAQMSTQVCGIPACAMVGQSQTKWNGFVRTRLRDALNRTVLCGDRGKKWLFWDADHFKETAQRSWATETGAPGGLSMFDGLDHEEFAIQIANERLVSKRDRADGRAEYTWKTKEPHDYGDCVAMCYAIAASQGLTSGTSAPRPRQPVHARRRVRIV